MPVYSANFPQLLWPGMRLFYGMEYAEHPEQYSQVFDVRTSTKYQERDRNMSGFGLVPQKPEGQSVTYDTLYDGWTTTYTHVTYGLGFSISRELYEDDQYNIMRGRPKALARSVRQTIEVTAANVLNNAFTSVCGDGQYLLDTDHPLIGGGTWRNKPTVDADLSTTSLEAALVDIRTQWVDDRGLKVNARPKKLIIHPANAWQAEMLLKSTLLPDTPNNAINPAKGIIPEGYVILDWLTDADAWFIQTDVPNGLVFFWRRRPEFTNDSEFDSENAKYKTTFRFSVGATDPRGLWGTSGG